jgi:hypothetical protein
VPAHRSKCPRPPPPWRQQLAPVCARASRWRLHF